MGDQNNDWNQWSIHVLKELERLNTSYEKISEDVQDLKSKMANYSPETLTKLQLQVETLEGKDKDQETRLRDLETKEAKFSGKWAIIGMVGAAVLSLVVTFMFNAMTAEPPKDNKSGHDHDKHNSYLIEDLEELRTLPS